MLELPPLSLYVHVPWCVRKCPYCDFNSHEKVGQLPEQAYVDALIRDLEFDAPYLQGRAVSSIFIGGGTPSLFSAHSIDRLLTRVNNIANFSDSIEITLEANPGTAEAKRFTDFRHCGVNRLSLGVQSFDDAMLKRLGRIHNGSDASKAIAMAKNAGFDDFNIDLMYGLPEQSLKQAEADLLKAFEFGSSHLSWYQLTLESNTLFYSKPPSLPADELLTDINDAGLALLSEHGFDRYEVSAFSCDARQSLHNTNYWQFGDYLGIGAGAHGKISLPADGEIIRTRKYRQPQHYLDAQASFIAERTPVPNSARSFEFLMNGLRLRHGIANSLFQARTGLAFSTLAKKVESLREKGLLDDDDNVLRTTERGYLLLNSVLEEFLDG